MPTVKRSSAVGSSTFGSRWATTSRGASCSRASSTARRERSRPMKRGMTMLGYTIVSREAMMMNSSSSPSRVSGPVMASRCALKREMVSARSSSNSKCSSQDVSSKGLRRFECLIPHSNSCVVRLQHRCRCCVYILHYIPSWSDTSLTYIPYHLRTLPECGSTAERRTIAKSLS